MELFRQPCPHPLHPGTEYDAEHFLRPSRECRKGNRGAGPGGGAAVCERIPDGAQPSDYQELRHGGSEPDAQLDVPQRKVLLPAAFLHLAPGAARNGFPAHTVAEGCAGKCGGVYPDNDLHIIDLHHGEPTCGGEPGDGQGEGLSNRRGQHTPAYSADFLYCPQGRSSGLVGVRCAFLRGVRGPALEDDYAPQAD